MHKYTIPHLSLETIVSYIIVALLSLIAPINKFVNYFSLPFTLPETILANFFISGTFYFWFLYNFLFCKYLWKVPNLNGTWEIKGISNNLKYQKKFNWKGTLEICQTLKDISIELVTENSISKSKSISASLKKNPNNTYTLEYSYTNSPNNIAPKDMRNHEGKCTITFKIDEMSAEGSYFNNNRDRETNGIMNLKKKEE